MIVCAPANLICTFQTRAQTCALLVMSKSEGSDVNMIGFRAAHGADAISGSVPVWEEGVLIRDQCPTLPYGA